MKQVLAMKWHVSQTSKPQAIFVRFDRPLDIDDVLM